jgi:hypothetical protein
MRTYVAGAYTTGGGSTDLGGSDDTGINKKTLLVRDDCEISIHKVHTNGAAAWEM